jgi:uncharacterized membrane protein
MSLIPYAPATAASLLAGLIIWWAYGRFPSRAMKALFAVGTVLVSFVFYVVAGVILIPMVYATKTEAGAAGATLGHGFKVLGAMLLVVNATVLATRGRTARRAD